MAIHNTAIVDSRAEISPDVEIGPYSVIKGAVKIDSGTKIDSHVSIGHEYGIVEIGKDNIIHQGAVVGGPPQDLAYKNEKTKLIVGNSNNIREFVTLNLGTTKDKGETVIGNDNLLMAYVHVAHDCVLHNKIVIANSGQLAGHVEIEDHAVIGGCVGISQFVKLGKFCYIGGSSNINKDVLPFSIAEGTWAVVRATNKVGLTRAGFEKDEVSNIHKAIRMVIKGGRTIEEAVETIRAECTPSDNIDYLIHFIENSKKGLAR
tara:strand:- start:50942 stop:51724 length:783 start_codon:yes stop_codon:yes gene_type:complete